MRVSLVCLLVATYICVSNAGPVVAPFSVNTDTPLVDLCDGSQVPTSSLRPGQEFKSAVE